MDYDVNQLPMQYRPLSPWAYFGYTVLFSIPVVGIIFLIIFALSSDNINRRNFARSYFCTLALGIILVIIFSAIGISAGVLSNLTGLLM